MVRACSGELRLSSATAARKQRPQVLPRHANAVAVGNRSTIGNGSIAPIKGKQRDAIDPIPVFLTASRVSSRFPASQIFNRSLASFLYCFEVRTRREREGILRIGKHTNLLSAIVSIDFKDDHMK